MRRSKPKPAYQLSKPPEQLAFSELSPEAKPSPKQLPWPTKESTI